MQAFFESACRHLPEQQPVQRALLLRAGDGALLEQLLDDALLLPCPRLRAVRSASMQPRCDQSGKISWNRMRVTGLQHFADEHHRQLAERTAVADVPGRRIRP